MSKADISGRNARIINAVFCQNHNIKIVINGSTIGVNLQKRHSEFCKMSIFQLCIPIAQTIRFGLFHTICKSCGTAHFFCLSSAFERHVSYFIPKETMNPRIINTIVSRKYVSNRFFMVLTEPASDSTDSDVFVPSLPCFFGFSPSFIKTPHSVQNAFRLPDEKQHKSSTDCFFSVFCGLSL